MPKRQRRVAYLIYFLMLSTVHAQPYILDSASITTGSSVLEDKSIQVVGQAVAGAVSNAEYSLEVGQVYGLLAAFKGDFDDDFVIGTADLSVFVNVVLGVDADPLRAREADMNGDGAVNSNDIQPFVSAMLATN